MSRISPLATVSSRLATFLPALLSGAAAYPNLVFSTPNHIYDMNIYNSGSTERALGVKVLVAIIGCPSS